MALSAATIATTIQAQLDSTYGAVTGAALTERQKFTTALGSALFTVLTTQATVLVTAVQSGAGTAPGTIT